MPQDYGVRRDEELALCITCKVSKPVSEMVKDRRKPKGYRSQCSACDRLACAAYRESHRQQERERGRTLDKRIKEHQAEVKRRYLKEHPEVVKARRNARAGTEKEHARETLRRAVRSGRISKPLVCQDCGRSGVQLHGHHHDYTKPFDVVWVCPQCHGKRHWLPNVEQEIAL